MMQVKPDIKIKELSEELLKESSKLTGELEEREKRIGEQNKIIENLAEDIGKIRQIEQELREAVDKLQILVLPPDESEQAGGALTLNEPDLQEVSQF